MGRGCQKNRSDVTWDRNIKNMIMKDTSMCSEVDGKVVVNDKHSPVMAVEEQKPLSHRRNTAHVNKIKTLYISE